MNYPKGTKFSDWWIVPEKQKGKTINVVRRLVYEPGAAKPSLVRLPVEQYRLCRDDLVELRKLVIRLNDQVKRTDRMRENIEIRHAFIDTDLLDAYRDYLFAQIPSKDKAGTNLYYLKRYFLAFFIHKMEMNDPLQWHAVHETEWAKFLCSEEAPAAAETKKTIIAAANRFMTWLHKRRPTEVPPLVFKPLTTAKYKDIEAHRQLSGEAKVRKNIIDTDYSRILKKAPADLKLFIELAYFYGLRRAEILGLKVGDVRKTYLSLERQLIAFTDGKPVYGPLKGREQRKVPHWNVKPQDAYDLISSIQDKLMHPDTLTSWYNETMDLCGLDYDIHDLRHTWVTKALRGHEPRDVQLAAGHTNIQTTMKYAHDDRELEDAVFVPDKRTG